MNPLRIAALACLVVLLGLGAQALASGKDYKYSGAIDQPPQDEFSKSPTLDIYVHAQRKRTGKLVIKLPRVNIFNAWFDCSNVGRLSVGLSTGGSASRLDLVGIKVRHRSFSKTENVDGTITNFSGSIPRHGAATGTVRFSGDLGPQIGQCESGVLNWSAKRK
jgi:hypothetical protein